MTHACATLLHKYGDKAWVEIATKGRAHGSGAWICVGGWDTKADVMHTWGDDGKRGWVGCVAVVGVVRVAFVGCDLV